jgi:RNA polymerase sigma factor (sigma-70 family)
MTADSPGHLLQRLRHLVGVPPGAEITDGQLLERYVAHREDDAFALLLQRHGPMVLGICRRLVGDTHRAEDAFQATFLVLVSKAGTILKHDSVASWLYGVAYRTARRAKADADRNSPQELSAMEDAGQMLATDASWHELRPVLDEEVNRLPEKFRAPVILCYLEGKTNEEAAQHLHWPVGTVKGRLSQARDLLRSRLTRRGLTLAGVTLGATTALPATAAVPPALAAATMQSAAQVVAGAALANAAPAGVAILTQRVLRSMLLAKVKAASLLIVAVAVPVLGVGIGLGIFQPGDDESGPIVAAGKSQGPDMQIDVPQATQPPKPLPPEEVKARIKKVDHHNLVVMIDGKEQTVAILQETDLVDPRNDHLKDGLRNPHLHDGVEVMLTFAENDGKRVCTKVKLLGR